VTARRFIFFSPSSLTGGAGRTPFPPPVRVVTTPAAPSFFFFLPSRDVSFAYSEQVIERPVLYRAFFPPLPPKCESNPRPSTPAAVGVGRRGAAGLPFLFPPLLCEYRPGFQFPLLLRRAQKGPRPLFFLRTDRVIPASLLLHYQSRIVRLFTSFSPLLPSLRARNRPQVLFGSLFSATPPRARVALKSVQPPPTAYSPLPLFPLPCRRQPSLILCADS